jgi:hypothetical protein
MQTETVYFLCGIFTVIAGLAVGSYAQVIIDCCGRRKVNVKQPLPDERSKVFFTRPNGFKLDGFEFRVCDPRNLSINNVRDILSHKSVRVETITTDMLVLPDVDIPFTFRNGNAMSSRNDITMSFLKNKYIVYRKGASNFDLNVGDTVFAFDRSDKTVLIPLVSDELLINFAEEELPKIE